MAKPYPACLQEAISARAGRYKLAARPGRFAILTTVYTGTDAALFEETAACLLQQTMRFDAWIILAHGPISTGLELALSRLAKDPRITVLREPINLGIMGGMRVCLQAAATEYAVPMDADDLLTADALQVLSAEIDRAGSPALLYSDEDILVDGVPQSPYWRPDWDPVLNLASSYIWHLCCIRRDAALRANLYTDAEATWCHDWDTVFRIAQLGDVPLHVPEILYHWRQHPASTTNAATGPADGSRRSTRHLLQRFVAQQANPSLYEIRDFPIFRGAPEWYVLRRHEASPPIAVVGLFGAPQLPASIPAARRTAVTPPSAATPPRGTSWLPALPARALRQWLGAAPAPTAGTLLQALSAVVEPHVLLVSATVRPLGDAWWWEAAKLFELHPEVAMVCGVLTNRRDRILRGAEVLDEAGEFAWPQAGHKAKAAGPFALWLKPQCVDAAPTDFCFVETTLLRDTLATLSPNAPLGGLGLRLADRVRQAGRLTAWSPLIKAVAQGKLLDGRNNDLPDLARRILGEPGPARSFAQRSRLARYLNPDVTAPAAATSAGPCRSKQG